MALLRQICRKEGWKSDVTPLPISQMKLSTLTQRSGKFNVCYKKKELQIETGSISQMYIYDYKKRKKNSKHGKPFPSVHSSRPRIQPFTNPTIQKAEVRNKQVGERAPQSLLDRKSRRGVKRREIDARETTSKNLPLWAGARFTVTATVIKASFDHRPQTNRLTARCVSLLLPATTCISLCLLVPRYGDNTREHICTRSLRLSANLFNSISNPSHTVSATGTSMKTSKQKSLLPWNFNGNFVSPILQWLKHVKF